jgi:hypothetical protein
MIDNLDPRERGIERGRDKARQSPAPRMSDREVPLGKHRTPQAVQAWLDGDLPEAAARRGAAAEDVDFWKRINEESEKRRRMRTPVHVQQRIMEALPQTTPRVITPWWRRPLAVTPSKLLLVGLGILALGAALSFVLLRAQ